MDKNFPEKSGIDKILLWYERQPWLRAIIQIPFGGGSADTLLAWRAKGLNEKRFENLISNLSKQLLTLKESALNKDFLQSEEFFEIFRTSVEAAIRTASDYKRKYIAKFLAGTIKRGNINDLSQQMAEDIKELQDFHLHILDYLPTETDVPVNAEGPKGMLREVFNKGCTDLEKMGFIHLDNSGIGKLDSGTPTLKTTNYLVTFKKAVTE